MFFIVSTGRSGTMSIAKTLSQIKGCVALHEPSPELIMESSLYHYGELAEEKLNKILLETRKPTINGSVYCESNQTLSLMIPLLTKTFPEAQFIWLIRNGLDVVASTMQKQWYTGHSENHERYEDCPPIERAWIDGRIEADRCGDMSPEEWKALDRFGRCCWYWSYVNRVIKRDIKNCGAGHYFMIRLEEIDEKFQELVGWMGFKTASARKPVKANKAKKDPYHWSMWSEDEKKVFEKFCAELMDRYYPSWRSPDGKWRGVEYGYGAKTNGIIDRIKGLLSRGAD